MAPFPWLVMLESLAYQQLMKSPTFHKGVEQVVKTVHRVRHGVPPDELGGTKLDEPGSRFGQHFYDELRTQLGTAEKEQAKGTRLQGPIKAESKPPTPPAEDAESAWQELQQRSGQAPKQGFMDNYLETLRGQVNQKKPPP
ncbi:hypothetical protein AMS68_006320 [Peltaster fructicola]|uniref:Uncharacterized protein n=1 Tax=Peltaster fructicola TaxID=286661 RepID=A0A6H0Y1C4_9PEZI|nr:hypothetical protein AMS68_006320 [Peltaster fructicola]